MARIKIHDTYVLSVEYEMREKYWAELSSHLINKYGNQIFKEEKIVGDILIDSFQYLVDEFKQLIIEEKSFQFFRYIFWLHEESVKLYIKTLQGEKLEGIEDGEFALYRRILKNILEQGCDIDLENGKFPDEERLEIMDNKIQRLLYLGLQMYVFADFIAYQKMIEECHYIYFDENESLAIKWQHHYGGSYETLFSQISKDYENATITEGVEKELLEAIEHCYGIERQILGGQIMDIKRYHSPDNPELQTIDSSILPINLNMVYNTPIEDAKNLYAGLTISRKNKMSVEELILKPYSINRHMFRPILIYNIDGKERALVGLEKFTESIMVLATNAIQWHAFPVEWLKNKCMEKFKNRKSNEHDKVLEDLIETILIEKSLLYCRNIKSFKQKKGNNINIDNSICGEIDFIIVDILNKKIIVSDSKYNRTRYEAVGYRYDYTNFTNDYEPKLKKKKNWIEANKIVLSQHLEIIKNIKNLNLEEFEVEAVFFINAPTFYMFNGNYKAITLKQIPNYLDGIYEYPIINYITENEDGSENNLLIQHPYFKKVA